jgi:hypothetical protein
MPIDRRTLFTTTSATGLLLSAAPGYGFGGGSAPNGAVYNLSGKLPQSRSISPENPTGAPGQGGKSISALGVGRKGRPMVVVHPGQETTMADIEGSGVIRRIWMTTDGRTPDVMRSLILRIFWDGQTHPSVECPIGDFFGFSHGKAQVFETSVHTCSRFWGLNFRLPMPFNKKARITFENPTKTKLRLFFTIDYTLEDHQDAPRLGYLHCAFRRENPTTLRKDFTLLEREGGRGRFLGAVVGVRRQDDKNWWGEGEFKAYLDGDSAYPTICGTGLEDYIGMGWGMGEQTGMLAGCLLNQGLHATFYRWHFDDAIFWQSDCRFTMQQLGWDGPGNKMVERQDDWAAAAFWYEQVPSQPLPPLAPLAERTAELWPKT